MTSLLKRPDTLFAIGVILVLSLATLIYWPGISGPFLFDDGPNLSELGRFSGITDFESLRNFVFSNFSGPTGRPVAMLSFLLNAQDWPANPVPFKITNIVIHLLCGLSICWFAFLLSKSLRKSKTTSMKIALIVMGIWLLHPLNVSTTLYVVQRMTQLMTLFATLSLAFYLLGRGLLTSNYKLSAFFLFLCLFPFALLSVFSKESGALLLLAIVVIEVTIFRDQIRTSIFRMWFRIGVIIPIVIVIVYLSYTASESLALYEFRNFTLSERLLTESRIVTAFVFKIFLPDQLLGSVLHDSYPISTGLFTPVTTVTALMFLFALLGGAIVFRVSHPVLSFGILWFFVFHLLESTYLPLELYFEHRNYIAMVGPLFAGVWYLYVVLESKANKSLKNIARISVLSLVAFSVSLMIQITKSWGDSLSLYSHMADLRPNSIRARLTYAEALEIENHSQEAFRQLVVNAQAHPTEAVSLVALWSFACRNGMDQPFSLHEVAEIPNLELSSQNLNYFMDQLIGYAQSNTCMQINTDDLESLFNRLDSFPIRGVFKSNYYYSFSNLYLLLQMPDAALAKLERSAEVNETVNVRVWQALVAAGANQWDQSLNYLQLAKELDSLRSALIPSRIEYIEQIESIVISRGEVNENIQEEFKPI